MMASNCSGLSRSLPRGLVGMDDRSRTGTGFGIVVIRPSDDRLHADYSLVWEDRAGTPSYPIRRSSQSY